MFVAKPAEDPQKVREVSIVGNQDDWEGLYVDGELRLEGHSLGARQVLEELGVEFKDVACDAEWLGNRGRLPETLKEVLVGGAEESQEGEISFEGRSLVLSGKFCERRKEIEKLVERRGGQVTSSLSGKTDYLVIGVRPSSAKLKRAEALGVRVVTDVEFWCAVGADGEK